MQQCFVLRSANGKNFMKFYVGPEQVRVHGPCGASDSFNDVVSKDVARLFWKELKGRGWEQVSLDEAPVGDWWFLN